MLLFRNNTNVYELKKKKKKFLPTSLLADISIKELQEHFQQWTQPWRVYTQCIDAEKFYFDKDNINLRGYELY